MHSESKLQKVCGFCNFVHILWKVKKLHRKLASDVTCHKKLTLACVKSQTNIFVVVINIKSV